ncbi:hypothetical protein [Thiomicrospira microaerophila]|uniref:hypothetical protein n=1 Tax=Thiomicrospira microaerophila TaxID=406020 RepID=UPI0005C8380C|nr:hypothetical protein [Thiomicrospira microaerophila]
MNMKERLGKMKPFDSDDIQILRESSNPLILMQQRTTPYHVKGAIINFLAATGVLTNATEITRLTRAVMDNDKGPLQEFIRNHFNPAEAKEISSWMDRVPDSTISGGWAHRLHHGHDLEAMTSLYQEYGLTGAAEWFNHVWLRDFWTPHGVPYLPSGSGEVYGWLVSQGVSKSTAMSLVSINAAEALSGLLFIRAGLKIRDFTINIIALRKYEAQRVELKKLISDGLDNEAYTLVERMRNSFEEEQLFDFRLDLAHYCLELSNREDIRNPVIWGEMAYKIADNLCRYKTQAPALINYLGNTKVSFVGLAATISATAFASHVQNANTTPEAISSTIKLGIRAYLEAGADINKGVSMYGVKVYGFRPYSALTNYKLAMDLALSLSQLERVDAGGKFDPLFIRREMFSLINELSKQEEDRSLVNEIKAGFERVYPINTPISNLPAVI